jgi:hypothetical protein
MRKMTTLLTVLGFNLASLFTAASTPPPRAIRAGRSPS